MITSPRQEVSSDLIVVVLGVSGCGKSTVASALAESLSSVLCRRLIPCFSGCGGYG